VRPSVSDGAAVLTLGTIVENQGKQAEAAKVSWQILDAAGKTVATASRRRSRSAWTGRELHGNGHAVRAGAVVCGRA